ncbi:MAG: transglutaminase domain-containing protein [Clostridia bacterium]|nr:transglutaminase domain-containing protein [Clostridia bacterium]
MPKLIALLLALLLLPAAHAEGLPYAASTVLSVLPLTPAQSALADYLYQPIMAGETYITLPKGTLYDDANAAMQALMQDYPELFHLAPSYSLGYYRNEPDYAAWVEPSYHMDASAAQSLRTQLYDRARHIARTAADPHDALDMLCQTVVYGGTEPMCHSAVGALLQGQATCEGYAQATTLVLRMMGVPCGMITGDARDSSGTTERHAWNIACFRGYTLIDLTWNDQDHLGLNTRWYSGLSTAQMAADHFPDAAQRIPVCGVQDNWHVLNSCVVSTRAEADAALRRLAAGESLNLRITDAALYRSLAHDTSAFLDGYNLRCPDAPFYGAYTVVYSDAQMCIILQPAQTGQ